MRTSTTPTRQAPRRTRVGFQPASDIGHIAHGLRNPPAETHSHTLVGPNPGCYSAHQGGLE